ncbi:methyltransferase [alpha proteobacterium BAL199]|jgi:FkbM family methyltransferase|nr:methyltransferase [alpha proteobacterium BAL199]
MLTNKVTRHGSFIFHSNDMIGKCLDQFGEWSEMELSFLLRLLNPGDVAVDVGAHIGTFTIPFAKKVGPLGAVIALEAQRLVFQNLVANVVINRLSNVRAHHVVCGRESYFVELVENTGDETSNSGEYRVKPSARHQRNWYFTRAEPLDALLSRLPKLKLIKIDVEGFEQEVLAGAQHTLRHLRPIIHCECLNHSSMEFLGAVADEHRYRRFAASFVPFNPENFFGRPPPKLPAGHRDTNVMLWPMERPLPSNLKAQEVTTFQDLERAPSPSWTT